MRNVYLLTTFKIFEGNSAGAARLLNIGRALAGPDCRVFLCSSVMGNSLDQEHTRQVAENIFEVGKVAVKSESFLYKNYKRFFNIFITFSFLRKLNRFIRQNKGASALYYYPDTEFSMDLLVTVYLKGMRGHKIYADINELRRTMLGNRKYAKNPLKKIYQFFSFSIEAMKYRIAEKLTRNYDGLVVISTNLEKYFSAYNKNCLRIPILSNCSGLVVSTPRYEGGEFKIGFTGQLATRKEGFENFYQSLSLVRERFPEIRLNLYGPIYEPFERELLLDILPDRYRLSGQISYHGNVAQQHVNEILRSQHLLVLPRPWNPQTHFGFSTKLSEYLVSGVPVLMTDVSDNALYIKDGVSGLVVKPGDPEEMAQKIIYLVEHYRELAPQLSANALQVARENFHYENYRTALLDFFFRN
jgi:glycosyltransferase involved in cell wall biosynthesis